MNFKKLFKTVATIAVAGAVTLLISACSDAEMASYNLSKDADQFKVVRKITLINTITDEVLYTVEGNMSVHADYAENQLEITAKVGENEYEKHFLGLSPTTVYIVEQIETKDVGVHQFKILIKPSAIIPDVDIIN